MTINPLLVLAQWLAESGFDFSPLLNTGVAAGVLFFLLTRLEPRLRAIENSINTQSKAMILVVLAFPNINNAEKDQAHALLREIDKKGE